MSDLIDRQTILKHIENLRHTVQTMDDIHRAITVIIGMDLCEEAVRNQPSAEPKIIRCKDCKYYDPIGVCIEMWSAVCEDSFCCWAEKTNEQSDRQAEINAMEKRIKDCNPDHFDYHYCSVCQNHNGKELPSEFCRYCGACMEVDDERSD